MNIASFDAFALAAKEYVSLVTTIKKVASVMSLLRAEQRRLNTEIHYSMILRDKRQVTCPDLTTLEIRTGSRRESLKRDHVVVELRTLIGDQGAEGAWERIQSKRPILESESLTFKEITDKNDI